MAESRIRHRKPIMWLPYPPYRETGMSGASWRPVMGFVFMRMNMKVQFRKTFVIAALVISVALPFSVSAAPSAGIKPSSFFYFLDIAAERVNLFFTFNTEKKVKKALEYADERLAEAQAVAGDSDTQAVKIAITNYESSISLAAGKSKDIEEKGRAEALLTVISDSTSRHQEVLADVLAKVPDEAKEAISKAIEASRRGQEEALQKISALKGEVEQLKQEVAELKTKDEEKERIIEELSKQKTESPAIQPKVSVPQVPVAPTQKPEIAQPQATPAPATPKTEPAKTSITTLPNGAVVEMDVNGNIIRTIKEAPQQVYVQPTLPVVMPTRPEVSLFDASKSTASIGDEVTLTWETKNAVICAISETDNISIPFTGRLPNGSLTIKLAETANLKIPSFKYYAICADKDWNTSVKTLIMSVLPKIEIKNAFACKTDLQTDYMLYDLLQNGNIDGRISMRIYLSGVNEQPLGDAELVIKTSDPSQDKTFKSGTSSNCGYSYGEYNFYTTQAGVFPIIFSLPSLNISRTITLNIKLPEKPIIGSYGITVSTPEKETDFPLSEIDNISATSVVKYWFQTSKPKYQYGVSAWCSDSDTAFSKVDMVSHLEKDGLYYYRGYFLRGNQFAGITTCKFIHSADSSMTISSESDIVTLNVK